MGPVDQSGDHSLTTSASWTQPAEGALIEQLPADWTTNSSLKVMLVVKENGISSPATATGWFDNITLTLDPESPLAPDVFKNGFE